MPLAIVPRHLLEEAAGEINAFSEGSLTAEVKNKVGISDEESTEIERLWAMVSGEFVMLEQEYIERLGSEPGRSLKIRIAIPRAVASPLEREFNQGLVRTLGGERAYLFRILANSDVLTELSGFGTNARTITFVRGEGDAVEIEVDTDYATWTGGHGTTKSLKELANSRYRPWLAPLQ